MAKVQLRGIVRWVALIFAIGIGLEVLGELGIAFLRIDNYAHAGGLITGGLIGWAFAPDRDASLGGKLGVTIAVVFGLAALVAWRIATFTCGT